MRWLILLLVPLGLYAKEVEIHCTYWYKGRIVSSEAAIIGEIVSVDSHVERSPSQVLPTESCIIRIDDVVGASPELQGATTAKLITNYIQDTYLQLEPDWGVYRHLHAGQKVVALIHRYEEDVAIGSDALIVLKPETMALPESLKRTGFDAALFTDDDLALWKMARPQMQPELASIVHYVREQIKEERRLGEFTPSDRLLLAVILAAVLAVGVWLVRHFLIRRSNP
ncbi:MAG: hypothetical protein R3F13_15355 [Prosthecobacter sp.]